MRFNLYPGEHLFDVDVGGDAGWVREGVQFLKQYWPHPV
jgi:hypothetical protein